MGNCFIAPDLTTQLNAELLRYKESGETNFIYQTWPSNLCSQKSMLFLNVNSTHYHMYRKWETLIANRVIFGPIVAVFIWHTLAPLHWISFVIYENLYIIIIFNFCTAIDIIKLIAIHNYNTKIVSNSYAEVISNFLKHCITLFSLLPQYFNKFCILVHRTTWDTAEQHIIKKVTCSFTFGCIWFNHVFAMKTDYTTSKQWCYNGIEVELQ